MMRIGRRGAGRPRRPAGRLNRMNGRNSTVPSRATSNGAASSSVDRHERDRQQADLRPELADVSAVHSFRKSAVGASRLARGPRSPAAV